MKSYISQLLKWCMTFIIMTQVRGGAIINQITYADGVPLTLSRTDAVMDGFIAPYQANMTGLSFRIDSPTENLTYNGLTVYAANQGGTSCSSTGEIAAIIANVGLYQGGMLLGSSTNVIATGSSLCAYEIPFTTTLSSGVHDFDIMFDTTGAAFNPEGGIILFVVDATSFPGLQTDMGTGIVSTDISGLADGVDLTAQNPGISDISNISTGASQVSYNNGYLTGFAVAITSKSVSDVILSGFTVGQIGTNKFGNGGYDIPHTISLLDTTGNILTTATVNQSGDIVFQNLNYIIPAGQTYHLHMMVSYTGDVVANDFRFQGSYRDVYDTSGHAYTYPTSVPGLSIDILENYVTALNTIHPNGGMAVNNLNGIYVGQMRFSSTTPGSLEQIALINVKEPFYGIEVSSGTLACSNSSTCDNISTGGDGLEVYLVHNSQIIASGSIISGAALLSLPITIPVYDQGDLVDIYVHDPDGIQQADETNKTVKLGLLNTQNTLDLGGRSIETIITADSNGDALIANFDDTTVVYNQYRIRNSLLSANVVPSLSGYQDITDIMYQTGVSLLGVQFQSTGSTSYIHQLVFEHESTVQVDNFGLTIDGDNNSNNTVCTLNSGFVACTLTGSYTNGLPIDSAIHDIILTADITGGIIDNNDHITNRLLSSTPQDYHMYDTDSIPLQHSIIYSDGSDPSLTPSSINWFTDAGIILNNISLEYNVGGIGGEASPIIITGISYQHTGNDYVFLWNGYTTGFVTVFIQNATTSGSYIQRATVAANSGATSPLVIGTTATYNVKFVPVTNTGLALGPDQIISLTHTGFAPTLFLMGNSSPFVELGGFFSDLGAYRDDGTTQGSDGIIVSGSVNTNQLGVYPITYDYSDSFGNAAIQVIRTVTVQDTTAPYIIISGGDALGIEFGSSYIDAGATATDNSTGATIDLIGSGTVDTMVLGDYYIYYEYSDPSGNTGYATRTVTVQDTTAPDLQLLGDSTITIAYNSAFSDSGALWTDAKDGTGIIYSSDTVPNIVGAHLVTYTYQDAAGNNSNTVNRTVNVIDNTIPIITINGSAIVIIEAGSTYNDAGALYNDDVAGVGPITASGSVNTGVPGDYLLTYDYTDAAGNTGVQQTRTVTVQDTTAPTISIIGSTGMTIPQGGTYHESGATWTDIVDGSGSTLVSGNVNTTILGTYYIEYNYTDAAGNTGSAIKTINITDQTAPLVSLSGSSNIILLLNTNYNEAGAYWTDNVDGSGVLSTPTTGSVNTGVVGIYALIYRYIDVAGNTGSISRTVTVIGGGTPVITLNGSGSLVQEIYLNYTDAGAVYSDVEDGTGNISLISGTVNTNVTGTYLLTYDYTDQQGNIAAQQIRTVTIVAPVCNPGRELVASGTDLSCNVCEAGSANTMTGGSCNLCPANTFAANQGSVSCTPCPGGYTSTTGALSCIDTAAPVITIVGSGITIVPYGSTYTELGANWSDNADGSGSVFTGSYSNTGSFTISGAVDTGTLGSYSIEYTKIDSNGNIGTTMRTVIVSILTPPPSTGSLSTGVTQSIIQGGGGSAGFTTAPTQKEQFHSSAPTITPLSQKDKTAQNQVPSSNQIVSIKIGNDGNIVTVRTWDQPNRRIFAKDLIKKGIVATGSTSGTGAVSDAPIILKKYWIITAEMLRNPRILKSYQPTWDAAPYQSHRTLAPKLQTNASNSFYRRLVDRIIKIRK